MVISVVFVFISISDTGYIGNIGEIYTYRNEDDRWSLILIRLFFFG